MEQETSQERGEYLPLDLSHYFNLKAAALAEDPQKERIDGHHAIRAEEMPGPGRVTLLDVPFLFPPTREERPDCMVPEGQEIPVPPGTFDALYVVGTAVLGSAACRITLAFAGGGQEGERLEELLRFTDWCRRARFGELEAVRANYRYNPAGLAAPANSLWLQVVPLPPGKRLAAVTLGPCPNLRIFCITLGRGPVSTGPEHLLHFVIQRTGAGGETIQRFDTLYRELLEVHYLFPDRGVDRALREIRDRVCAELSPEELHAPDAKRVRALLAEHLPRLEELERETVRPAPLPEGAFPLSVTLLGHSHLDAVWLWPWNETVEKAARTFSANLERLRRFEGAVFAQSTPLFYEWMERYRPAVFEGIRERVKAGRWEPVGGMWVEADGNLPSGEALVRQRLLGQRYFLSRFGRVSEVAWVPDTFGMHANLPQLLAKTGARYFFTTKLSWNQENIFPYEHFLWEGPEGSRVLALQCPVGCGESPGPRPDLAEQVRGRNPLVRPGAEAVVCARSPFLPEEAKSGEAIPEALVIYGEGDGGEGPSDKLFHRAAVLCRTGAYRHGTAHEHFRRIEARYGDRLPVWKDELYLENHRGTFSSQARIKALNRRAEAALLDAEKWAALRAALGGPAPDRAALERAWKTLCFLQFHDILPGTSIPQAYVDAEAEYDGIFRFAREARDGALPGLLARLHRDGGGAARDRSFPAGKRLFLFNPLSFDREDTVEVPFAWPRVRVEDLEGHRLPSQVIRREGEYRLCFRTKLPAFGYAAVRLLAAPAEDRVPREEDPAAARAEGRVLENRFLRAEVDGEGHLSRLYDKVLGKELLSGPANALRFFRNRPAQWSNWNLDPEYDAHELRPEGEVRIETADPGPVAAALRIHRPAPEGGRAVQEIRLCREERALRFFTEVDVRFRESLVKVSFPLTAAADHVNTEIGYGTYPRPLRPESPFERAKWELFAHRWIHVPGEGYGVVLSTRTTYGFDLKEGHPRLTLVKGGVEPDPDTDLGVHRFEYLLAVHEGGFEEAHAWRAGLCFNHPPAALLEHDPELDVPDALSFLSLSPGNLCLEAFKPAEDEGGGYVVRLWEVEGKAVERASLVLPFEVEAAEEIDFLERAARGEVNVSGTVLTFPVAAHEVKAIRIRPRPGGAAGAGAKEDGP